MFSVRMRAVSSLPLRTSPAASYRARFASAFCQCRRTFLSSSMCMRCTASRSWTRVREACHGMWRLTRATMSDPHAELDAALADVDERMCVAC